MTTTFGTGDRATRAGGSGRADVARRRQVRASIEASERGGERQ